MKSKASKKSMVQTTYKYSELTGKIIGCAMEAHEYINFENTSLQFKRVMKPMKL